MAVAPPVKLYAPAKLNLFLHVVGRRADGYHELESVFRSISLCDVITLEQSSHGREISLMAPSELGDPSDNLMFKAAQRLQDTSSSAPGANILLEKNIPVGAGLGGGSSDAAATLIGLNALWSLNYDLNDLKALAAEIGADVPFFVEGHDAWVSGIGEVLEPIKLPEAWYFVVFPNVLVPTAQIFSDPHLTRDTQRSKIARFLESPAGPGWKNDLERAVLASFPEVGKLKNWLSRRGAAKMSGSGSACFIEVKSREAAEALAESLPETWQGFAVSAGAVEPLQAQVRRLLAE